LATILSILWFVYQPSFEPAITALLGIAGLFSISIKRDGYHPSIEGKQSSNKRKTILYIEDDLVKTRFYMLEDSGYKVVPATNADQALREVKSEKFDLILLDIMMEPPRFVSKEIVHHGYETGVYLARRIKESINKDTPLIIVTANPLHEVEDKLRKIGIAAYLKKPFNQHDLQEEIESAFTRQSA
jgi:CheY-like chemotaxis protein